VTRRRFCSGPNQPLVESWSPKSSVKGVTVATSGAMNVNVKAALAAGQ
jgi:hypothetical protein